MHNEQIDDKDNINTNTNNNTNINTNSALLANIHPNKSKSADIYYHNNAVDLANIFIGKNNTKGNEVNNKIDDSDDDDVISIVVTSSKVKHADDAMHACVDVLVNALLALMRYKRASMQQHGTVCNSNVHTRVARKILQACND